MEKLDDKSILSPQEDEENPLHFSIFIINQILEILWVEKDEIREFDTEYRKATAISFKCRLNKKINSVKEYAFKAAVRRFENWNSKKGYAMHSRNINKKSLNRLVNSTARKNMQTSFATEKTRIAEIRHRGDEERSVMIVGLTTGPDAGEETVQLERKPQRPPTIRDSSIETPTSLQKRRLNNESRAPTVITIPPDMVIEQVSFKAAETTIISATDIVHQNIHLLCPNCPELSDIQNLGRQYLSVPLSRKHLSHWAWM